MKEQLERIQELENLISKLPQGSITYKTIHGKRQPYLQWTENGKTKSKYIKIAERETVMEQVSLRRSLQEELKTLKAESSSFVPIKTRSIRLDLPKIMIHFYATTDLFVPKELDTILTSIYSYAQ